MVVAIFGRPGALLDKNGVTVGTLSKFYPARSARTDGSTSISYLYLKPLKFGTEPNVKYGVVVELLENGSAVANKEVEG